MIHIGLEVFRLPMPTFASEDDTCAMEGFTLANNELMEGNNYDGTGDIRSYSAGGAFVDFGGVDKDNVTNAMNSFLLGRFNESALAYTNDLHQGGAGYDYDNNTGCNRVRPALESQWANPGAQGASWEGTFTIPVCDVSTAIEADYQDKQYILQPYIGDNSRPLWCGPVCGGNLTTTQAFNAAAQMTKFDSPKQAFRKESATAAGLSYTELAPNHLFAASFDEDLAIGDAWSAE
ncbi:hypothetical protein HO173_003002 [Letharia columbiana]|uniref:Uncharacterized protein n=1 Tax=Letharia columbiana TaxID=112416 RepID=A0A8H6L873_9LECA|nr:uncharacterized protein HO173_003002 [Letharia columbiana]KAF6239129.1 hypothetical protein HO173_003002 [Letharia columbiana]